MSNISKAQLLRKFLHAEYILFLFFIAQILLSSLFIRPITLVLFIGLFVYKVQIEGFRTSSIFFVIFQTILLINSSYYFGLPVIALTILAIWAFPIYHLPKTMGPFKVGYTQPELGPGSARFGIYYPTNEETHDIKFNPNPHAGRRFADVATFFANLTKKKPMNANVIIATTHHYYKQGMGVNKDARLVKEEQVSSEGFPMIVFSHALGANMHLYNIQLREWASKGFIVFTIDHDEIINKYFETFELHNKFRAVQIGDRKKEMLEVLNYALDQKQMSIFLKNKNFKINPNKVFVGGHSFGAVTAAEFAKFEPRVTGGVVMFDAWLIPLDPRVYSLLNKPILHLRSQEYNKRKHLRELQLKYFQANNEESSNAISGYLKDSTHMGTSDVNIMQPRELAMMRAVPSIRTAYNEVLPAMTLASTFLEETIKWNGKTDLKSIVLDKYRERLAELGTKDTLTVDS